jgi:hypothetical protein
MWVIWEYLMVQQRERSDSQKPTTAESCPVHVLCSNDSYASKQVKRSPFSAWKCLRRRSAAFTAASHAEGHWFDPSRDHKHSSRLEVIFGFLRRPVPNMCQTGEAGRHTDRVFYPRAAAEVPALDILHVAGGQHVTRATVEHHLGRLAAHRSGCACWRCQAAAKASIKPGVPVPAGLASYDADLI